MLKDRLLISALLIPATIGLFVWDDWYGPEAPILFVVLLVISARCVWELVTLARVVRLQPNLFLTIASVWSLIVLSWGLNVQDGGTTWFNMRDRIGPGFALCGMLAVLLLFNAVRRFPITSRSDASTSSESSVPLNSPGIELTTLAAELFAVVYVGLLLALTMQLRWAGHPGYYWLGALIVVTKMGDVGAYTFGRLIGGPKMVPKLSPGKTWAGGVGHLLTAGLSSVAWMKWLGPSLCGEQYGRWNLAQVVTFGVVVGFAGLMGDLAESLIKRDVGVKDAPALLPGFGGLLDLMDSILLAGPVAYGVWTVFQFYS